jgi:hypothetical protein
MPDRSGGTKPNRSPEPTATLAKAANGRLAKGTRGRPFVKGRSGNLAGRPRGSRNAATMAAESLLQGDAEALTRKAIELALSGDHFALRLCLERILPPTRERIVQFTLPPMMELGDAPKAIAALLAAVANGDVTPAEAAELLKLVDAFARAIEAKSLAERENLERSEQIRPIVYEIEKGLENL